MSPTSDDAMMTACLTRFGALKLEQQTGPQALLEILYLAERFEAGDDLQQAKAVYDPAVWKGVEPSDMKRRLIALDSFMQTLAERRLTAWGVPH
ncbi:MAG: hypothetical protein DCF29_17770 [Alphaproteobacteria bacterium]|nr:MAG: hypothetical protein DCF29_17770 [Alphaproteobacteria bacterium]